MAHHVMLTSREEIEVPCILRKGTMKVTFLPLVTLGPNASVG
jgi:hypothetical protein